MSEPATPLAPTTPDSLSHAPVRLSTEVRSDPALREFLRFDPVARLLLLGGRVHFVVVALLSLVLLLLVLIILPTGFLEPGTTPAPGDYVVSAEGGMMVVSWLVLVPVVWGFYAWQPVATIRLHARLDEARGASAPADLRRLHDWYRKPLWTVLATLLALWEFYRFMSPAHEFVNAGPWIYQSGLLLRVVFTALASVTYYMVVMLVVRQFITTIIIDRTFQSESLPVRFLHPDQCGGFRFLGEHALGIAPLIAAAGLTISLVYVRILTGGEAGSDTAVYSLVAVSVLYVLGSLSFFIALLWSAHQEMLRARDAWLDDIARGFEQQQVVVQEQMRSGNPDAASVAKLETARKAWEIGRSLPTWPLNVGNGRKFMAALLSPLVPIGISALRQLLVR